MMIRTDRRLGFNPTLEWDLIIRAIRRHGSFMPEIGVQEFRTTQSTSEEFFDVPQAAVIRPVWVESALARLMFRQQWVAAAQRLRPMRLGILAFTTIFIGWWGQGQLSIVTVIGTLRATIENTGFVFLLYDPFSLLVWVAAIVGFVLWGRGLFCGWLCPYGALQEFADWLGRLFGIKRKQVPERVDRLLKNFKYVLLALLIVTGIAAPVLNDLLVEAEPFKTAITVFFVREWWYVAYAAGWLVLGMIWFKPFCRYVCPVAVPVSCAKFVVITMLSRKMAPLHTVNVFSASIVYRYMTIQKSVCQLFCMPGARLEHEINTAPFSRLFCHYRVEWFGCQQRGNESALLCTWR